MEKFLKDILNELKYQTKLMENLFDKKDAKQGSMDDVHKSLDNLKKEAYKHAGLMDSDLGQMLNQVFSLVGGKK